MIFRSLRYSTFSTPDGNEKTVSFQEELKNAVEARQARIAKNLTKRGLRGRDDKVVVFQPANFERLKNGSQQENPAGGKTTLDKPLYTTHRTVGTLNTKDPKTINFVPSNKAEGPDRSKVNQGTLDHNMVNPESLEQVLNEQGYH